MPRFYVLIIVLMESLENIFNLSPYSNTIY